MIEAIANLKQALKFAPNFTTARNKLGVLSGNADRILYKQKVAKLSKVMLGKIDLDDATLEVALERVSQLISDYNKEHKTKHISNIVVMDPTKKLKAARIKLTLANVPATVILDNIMLLSGANYRLEEYVIRVKPNQP